MTTEFRVCRGLFVYVTLRRLVPVPHGSRHEAWFGESRVDQIKAYRGGSDVGLASPASAQSFNRSDGTGNELHSYYDSQGGLHPGLPPPQNQAVVDPKST
jgi:hypothetical protein